MEQRAQCEALGAKGKGPSAKRQIVTRVESSNLSLHSVKNNLKIEFSAPESNVNALLLPLCSLPD